jgi:hypothetical protein
MVVAEKGANSTWDRHPIQVHYRRDEWHRKTCLESALRFNASPRPIFSTGEPVPEPEAKAFSPYGTMKLVTQWTGSHARPLGTPLRPVARPAPGLVRRSFRRTLGTLRKLLKRSA